MYFGLYTHVALRLAHNLMMALRMLYYLAVSNGPDFESENPEFGLESWLLWLITCLASTRP
jgi:hypothetical protein